MALLLTRETSVLDGQLSMPPIAIADMPPMMMPTAALEVVFEIGPDDQVAKIQASTQLNHRQQRRQGFRVGDYALMVRYEDGRELTEMPPIYRLPNSPDWFLGMANLNGVPTPVFELARYLGIESSQYSKKMLLVLSHGIDAAGVVIDGLPERLKCSDSDRVDSNILPERLMPLQRAAYLLNERLWFDVKCDALLDALEKDIKMIS